MCFLLGKDSNLILVGLILYHRPVENTLILRGFHTDSTRKRPFLHAHLQMRFPQWPKHMAETWVRAAAIGSQQLALGKPMQCRKVLALTSATGQLQIASFLQGRNPVP